MDIIMDEPQTSEEYQRHAVTLHRLMTEMLAGGAQPWSDEVEDVRAECRHAHVSIIFDNTDGPQPRSLDGLWQHTTHTYMSGYRNFLFSVYEAAEPFFKYGTTRTLRGEIVDHNNVKELFVVLRHYDKALRLETSFWSKVITRIVRLQDLYPYMRDLLDHHPEIRYVRNAEIKHPLDNHVVAGNTAMVYEALLYIGDLRRYRDEMDVLLVKMGRWASRPSQLGASDYYHSAASLVPSSGMAYNRLATIAHKKTNLLTEAYYHLRATHVLNPYDPREGPLKSLLSRHFPVAAPHVVRAKNATVDDQQSLEHRFLYIMSVLYDGRSLDQITLLEETTCQSMFSLLSSGGLSQEMLLELTVALISVHRSQRVNSPGFRGSLPPIGAACAGEEFALSTLLATFGIMFEVFLRELQDVKRREAHALADGKPGLSLRDRISSTMHSMMPALRMASKWIRINFDYLIRRSSGPSSGPIAVMYEQYQSCMQSLFDTFPIQNLPGLSGQLKEDKDLQGFLPLSPVMATAQKASLDFTIPQSIPEEPESIPKDEHDKQSKDSKALPVPGTLKPPKERPDEKGLMRLFDLGLEASINLAIASDRGWVKPLRVPSAEDVELLGELPAPDHEMDPVALVFATVIDGRPPSVNCARTPSKREVEDKPSAEASSGDDENIVFMGSKASTKTLKDVKVETAPAPAVQTAKTGPTSPLEPDATEQQAKAPTVAPKYPPGFGYEEFPPLWEPTPVMSSLPPPPKGIGARSFSEEMRMMYGVIGDKVPHRPLCITLPAADLPPVLGHPRPVGTRPNVAPQNIWVRTDAEAEEGMRVVMMQQLQKSRSAPGAPRRYVVPMVSPPVAGIHLPDSSTDLENAVFMSPSRVVSLSDIAHIWETPLPEASTRYVSPSRRVSGVLAQQGTPTPPSRWS